MDLLCPSILHFKMQADRGPKKTGGWDDQNDLGVVRK